MGEAKFTPGPWAVQASRCRVEGTVWDSHGTRCVAQMVHSEDAALIAAAPDLYAAVKAHFDLYGSDEHTWPDADVPFLRAAKAALARAEGRS